MRDSSTWDKNHLLGDVFGSGRQLYTEGIKGFIDLHIGDVLEVISAAFILRVAFLPVEKWYFRKRKKHIGNTLTYIAVGLATVIIALVELLPTGTTNIPDFLDLFGVAFGGMFVIGTFELAKLVSRLILWLLSKIPE